MQDVGVGDVIAILIAFGIIHGIMYFVGRSKKRKSQADDDSGSD
jgi:hypothetical protein